MRNIFIPLIALLTAGLLSCKKDIPASQEVHLRLNDCRYLTECNETIRLCFDTVLQDSRCPINANCVWQGVAVARFTLHLNDGSHTLELATNEVLPNTTRDTTIKGYTITFKNLSPYPGESNEETPAAGLLVEYH
jgi:hypothetical protein